MATMFFARSRRHEEFLKPTSQTLFVPLTTHLDLYCI